MSLAAYIVHWTVIAIALTPGVMFLVWSWRRCFPAGELSWLKAFLFSLAIMLGYFIYILCGIVVFGLFIRVVSIGFKEGSYAMFSATAMRWLILSGIYNFACFTILPQVLVSPFINAFFSLVGCKIGKNARINTPFLNDAYLLEIGENSVIGGKATLSCHIFEKGRLVLKPIKIGENCVVGAHAYVHPGVVMEDNSAIGLYAMVTKGTVIRSKTVYGHLPAMPYRELARLKHLAKGKV
jgi:acetyltransferase-like isoleucine patch superfamily enzyme